MNRKQFTFYESFFRAISRVRRKASRADIYDAICRFALYGQEPEWESLEDTSAIALDLIFPNLQSGRERAAGAFQCNQRRDDLKRSKSRNAPSTLPQRFPDAPLTLPPHEKENENENKIEIETESESEAEGEAAVAGAGVKPPAACVSAYSDFDIFWKAYPKKVGKEKAKSAFEQCGQTLDRLLCALEEQKQSGQWTCDGGRFVPNPVPWLQEGRWEDQLPAQVPKSRGMNPSGRMGQTELAAIEEIMREGG